MRKILALVLAAAMIFAMGCGNSGTDSVTATSTEPQASVAATSTTETSASKEEEKPEEPEKVEEPQAIDYEYTFLNNTGADGEFDWGSLSLDVEELQKFETPFKLTVYVEEGATGDLYFQPLDYWYLNKNTASYNLYPSLHSKNKYIFEITEGKLDNYVKYGNLYMMSNDLKVTGITITGIKKTEETQDPVSFSETPFGKFGKLSVKGANIVGENGQNFTMVGMLNHWHMMDLHLASKETYTFARDDWGINTVRVSVDEDVDEGTGWQNPDAREYLKYWTYKKTDALTEAGMYVLIDYGSGREDLSDSVDYATSFFAEYSAHYADHDNIIYEIMNEPHGEKTKWKDVVEYANAVIPVIRANDPDAIIVVGTPNYSLDIVSAMKAPLEYDNIVYTFHYYPYYDDEWFRGDFKERTQQLEKAVKSGFPILVTEFGLGPAEGYADYETHEATSKGTYSFMDDLMTLLDTYDIGFVSWVDADSSLMPDCRKKSGWTDDDLTTFGHWYKGWTTKVAAEMN